MIDVEGAGFLALGTLAGLSFGQARHLRAQRGWRRDPMTGLETRSGFEQHAGRVLRRSVATVAMVDLDGLKKINDSLGHAEGDRFITQAAEQLRVWLPVGAVIARLGGDEFAACWPGSYSAEDFHQLSSQIQASVGVVRTPKGASLEAALGRADATMYLVKRRGGGWGEGGMVTNITEAPRRWSRNKDRLRGISVFRDYEGQ